MCIVGNMPYAPFGS